MGAVFVFLMGVFVVFFLAVIVLSAFMLSSHMSQAEEVGDGS